MTTSSTQTAEFDLKSLRCAAGTDVGMHREENQDSFGVIKGDDFHAYLVADGMGGAHGGAMASRMAISGMQEGLKKAGFRVSPSEVVGLIRRINKQIFDKGSETPALAGMGTTLVGLFFTSQGIMEINVGDSRAYRVRDGVISQISEDHTLVRELVRSGALPAEEAAHHPVSHLLTRSLGPVPDVQVECRLLSDYPREGDIYILCSDGLYNLVPESDICAVVRENPVDDANQILINLANRRGGLDNITVLIIAVGERSMRERATATEISVSDVTAELEASAAASRRGEQSDQPSPPAVQEPRDSRMDRAALRSKREALRRRTQYGPLPLIVGFALLLGLVVGEIARKIFPGPEGSMIVVTRDGAVKRSPLSEITGEESRVSAEAKFEVPKGGENPLAEVAQQIEGAVRLGAGAVDRPLERNRVEVEQSIARIAAHIERLSRSEVVAEQTQVNGARERVASLQREVEGVDQSIDAASRGVILWLGRQVQFGRNDAFESPSELETVGAYSDAVKATLESISKLSYQYREAADDVELHPNNDQYRVALEKITAKREELKARLRDEVRTAVASHLTKSYSEYQTLKTRRDALVARLAEAKIDVEVATASREPDVAKRQVVLQKLQSLLKAEREQLASLAR